MGPSDNSNGEPSPHERGGKGCHSGRLILILSTVCVLVGLIGAAVYSGWEWLLVGYGLFLAVLGLIPFRAADQSAVG